MTDAQVTRTFTPRIRARAWRHPRRRRSPYAGASWTDQDPSRAAAALEGLVHDPRAFGCKPVHLLAATGIDREFVTSRRIDGRETTSYETLPSMDSPNDASASDTTDGSADGISALVARILEQLSLSAWIPAAFLAASLALLLQFRSDKSVGLLNAVSALTADPVRVLVLIVPVLVLATVVTQAFSFEAIRTLEGYWHRRGPASFARTLMIKRHVYRANALTRRRKKASKKAYDIAELRMLEDKISLPVVNAMKAQALEVKNPPSLTDAEKSEFEQHNWENWCDAWHIARLEHLRDAEEDYPLEPHRILPTKLGNLIRATEDQLENAGDNIQGFALRRYASVPRLVQEEHDKFRSRLELYCTLVFVSGSLLVLTPLILLRSGIGVLAILIVSSCFGALSEASYLAAIASARGYCSALKEMDEDSSASS